LAEIQTSDDSISQEFGFGIAALMDVEPSTPSIAPRDFENAQMNDDELPFR